MTHRRILVERGEDDTRSCPFPYLPVESSWCHSGNTRSLLFLIESVQSVGFTKPNIYSQDGCFITATSPSGLHRCFFNSKVKK